jgi:hypothetical protein
VSYSAVPLQTQATTCLIALISIFVNAEITPNVTLVLRLVCLMHTPSKDTRFPWCTPGEHGQTKCPTAYVGSEPARSCSDRRTYGGACAWGVLAGTSCRRLRWKDVDNQSRALKLRQDRLKIALDQESRSFETLETGFPRHQ